MLLETISIVIKAACWGSVHKVEEGDLNRNHAMTVAVECVVLCLLSYNTRTKFYLIVIPLMIHNCFFQRCLLSNIIS